MFDARGSILADENLFKKAQIAMAKMLILALLLSSWAIQITLLSTERSNLRFTPYNGEQKILIAQAASNLLNIYVHRQEKIDFYKSEYPQIDPIPRIQNILENASKMADHEFHYNMSALFKSMRDFHTSYTMPLPHSCFTFQSAVSFQLSDPSNSSIPNVLVSGFNSNFQITNGSPDLKKITIGDKLLKINGMSFMEYSKRMAFVLGGANKYGSMRAAQASLTSISGSTLPPPELDYNALMLEKINGEKYNVKMPWFAVKDETCLNSKASVGKHESKDNDTLNSDFKYRPVGINHGFFSVKKFDAIVPAFKMHNTDEATISWGIYDPQNTKLGIISIASFTPSSDDTDATVSLIEELLTTKLQNTNAVVFDVRENPGGFIDLAEKIPQLFGKNVLPANFRALNNDMNHKILSVQGKNNQWKDAVTTKNEVFTTALPIDVSEDINTRPVAYSKPVGLLMNANCYSACDLFAANMQDNGIAKIYGEDGYTGGGGAEVVQYNDRLSKLLSKETNNPFPKLPQGSVDFTIAWRQMLRIGKHPGQLIEDYGVAADLIVRPSLQDVVNRNSASQWDRIADDLIQNRPASYSEQAPIPASNDTKHFSLFLVMLLTFFL